MARAEYRSHARRVRILLSALQTEVPVYFVGTTLAKVDDKLSRHPFISWFSEGFPLTRASTAAVAKLSDRPLTIWTWCPSLGLQTA
jgi:hypothetical protein